MSLRISAVVEETGISKELVHHYLRQGLLPKSKARASYSSQQVRLLKQIRLLREDHHLPLEVIRNLFAIFEFDPARIESLTLGESLSKRITEFTAGAGLLSHQTITAEELYQLAGITGERLAEFVDAGLISVASQNGEERYSIYDARVVALCENGVALGIPFESFRTIASYVRIAFELEHAGFYDVVRDPSAAGGRALADLFVRWEISGSFVQNVLGALTVRRLRDFLEQTQTKHASVDDVVYRPSRAFNRRHRLDSTIDRARQKLGEDPEDAERWLQVARLMRHAGRYEEAAFFLEESLEKWPADQELRAALGRVHVLLGDNQRGIRELGKEQAIGSDPRSPIFLALAHFRQACEENDPEALLRDTNHILQHIDRGLAATTERSGNAELEATMLAGWLLTSMPQMFGCHQRGVELLQRSLRDAEALAENGVPGFRDRCRINAAYLLFNRLATGQASAEPGEGDGSTSVADLRALICRLDPASAFAEAVFLAETESPIDRRQTR